MERAFVLFHHATLMFSVIVGVGTEALAKLAKRGTTTLRANLGETRLCKSRVKKTDTV